jgi:hypothetical protein
MMSQKQKVRDRSKIRRESNSGRHRRSFLLNERTTTAPPRRPIMCKTPPFFLFEKQQQTNPLQKRMGRHLATNFSTLSQ